MNLKTSPDVIVDERAYGFTRPCMLVVAWSLIGVGLLRPTPELATPLLLAATGLFTLATVMTALSSSLLRVRFETVLFLAMPVDVVALGMYTSALREFGDPMMALMLAFVMLYAHVLDSRRALVVAVAAAASYFGGHALSPGFGEWHDYFFVGVKTIIIVYAGVMGISMSERRRARQHERNEAVRERIRLSEELEHRVEDLQAILAFNDMIHSDLESVRAGERIVRILCDALEIPGARFVVENTESGDILFRASSEVPEDGLECVPVLERDDVRVHICVEPEEAPKLGERQLQVLQAASAGLAAAVENSRLYGLTRHLSVIDELTGLHNYRYLQQRLAEEFERSLRYGHSFSLLMIDVDDFKLFNDTHGHLAGDRALADIGRILAETVRQVDVAVRYGGEEFSAILPEADRDGAAIVAEKVRRAVEAHEFCGRSGEGSCRLTVSIGIGSFPEQATDGESLFRVADDALYRAKLEGKNRVKGGRVRLRDSETFPGDTSGPQRRGI